jgi:hypothetical protein
MTFKIWDFNRSWCNRYPGFAEDEIFDFLIGQSEKIGMHWKYVLGLEQPRIGI